MNKDELDFLLNDFVDRVFEVSHILVVSADGLLLACNAALPKEEADRLAAIAAGLVSLLGGAARSLDASPVVSNMTELSGGYLFSMAVSGGANVLALGSLECDIGQVSHELTVLINRVGPALSPQNRAGLWNPGQLLR